MDNLANAVSSYVLAELSGLLNKVGTVLNTITATITEEVCLSTILDLVLKLETDWGLSDNGQSR